MVGKLEGRVALITGGARGIGLAIARRFLEEGADVGIADLDSSALDEAIKSLDVGPRAISLVGDVSQLSFIGEMVADTVRVFGGLDVLVNNAGGSAYTSLRLEALTEVEYQRVLDWNLKSALFCSQAALPHLKQGRWSSIVNLASIAGRAGSELISPQYSAAKAAVIGLTRSLARHLGPDGIRVNAIAPGFISSGERVDEIWATRDTEAVLNSIALRRRGNIEEIAAAALFFGCQESSYATGAVLDVNGGYLS